MVTNTKYMKWERKFMRSDAHYDPDYPPLPAAAWNAALRHAIKVVDREVDVCGQMEQIKAQLKLLMYK